MKLKHFHCSAQWLTGVTIYSSVEVAPHSQGALNRFCGSLNGAVGHSHLEGDFDLEIREVLTIAKGDVVTIEA